VHTLGASALSLRASPNPFAEAKVPRAVRDARLHDARHSAGPVPGIVQGTPVSRVRIMKTGGFGVERRIGGCRRATEARSNKDPVGSPRRVLFVLVNQRKRRDSNPRSVSRRSLSSSENVSSAMFTRTVTRDSSRFLNPDELGRTVATATRTATTSEVECARSQRMANVAGGGHHLGFSRSSLCSRLRIQPPHSELINADCCPSKHVRFSEEAVDLSKCCFVVTSVVAVKQGCYDAARGNPLGARR
jgi:hypothetical protein